MAEFSVEVVMDQHAIDRLSDHNESLLAKNLLRRGNRVEKQAKLYLSGQRVNVRTGRLRSSVHTELFRTADGTIGCRVGTDVYYGRFLDQGTRYIRPRHWLTDALDAARDKV